MADKPYLVREIDETIEYGVKEVDNTLRDIMGVPKPESKPSPSDCH